MKKYLIIVLLMGFTSAIAQNWTPTTSVVSFKVKMMGLNVDGSLKGMKTNLKFTDNEPSALSATVESKTVNTSNSLRDKHLKEKGEFFQPELFPTVSMSSVSISKVSENNYSGIFKVTIKGISKNIKIPFVFQPQNEKAVLKSDFIINRQDWNFGGNTPGMADNVKIGILVNMEKK